jgi:hypothetical protein
MNSDIMAPLHFPFHHVACRKDAAGDVNDRQVNKEEKQKGPLAMHFLHFSSLSESPPRLSPNIIPQLTTNNDLSTEDQVH